MSCPERRALVRLERPGACRLNVPRRGRSSVRPKLRRMSQADEQLAEQFALYFGGLFSVLATCLEDATPLSFRAAAPDTVVDSIC